MLASTRSEGIDKNDEDGLLLATRNVLESSGREKLPDRHGGGDSPPLPPQRGSSQGDRARMMAQQYGSSWFLTEVQQGRPRSSSQELMFTSVPQQKRRERRAKLSMFVVFIFSILFISSLIKKKLSSADGELGPFTKTGFLPLSEPHPVKPNSKLWGSDIGPPYPTGAWWLNALIDDGKAPVPATPYQLLCSDIGISLSYSVRRRVADKSAQLDPYSEDFLFIPTRITSAKDARTRILDFEQKYSNGRFVIAADALRASLHANESAISRSMTEHSHLGISMQYELEGIQNDKIPKRKATALIVKGSPAFAIELNNSPLLIASGQGTGGRILNVENITTAPNSSGTADIRAADGSRWFLIWSLAYFDSTLEALSFIPADTNERGLVRFGYMPYEETSLSDDNKSITPLKQCPWTYAKGGHIDIDSTYDTSAYRLRWEIHHALETENIDFCKKKPPLLGLPHHKDLVLDSLEIFDSDYFSIKGQMYWIRAAHWTLWEKLPPIPKFHSKHESPLKSDMTKRRIISAQLRRDVRILKAHASFLAKNGAYGKLYFEGKELARLARLILVADEVEDPEAKNWAIVYLERRFDRILRSDDNFAYDPTWGGLISLPVTEHGDPFSNFGNALYSDHHFHYGYYCYAAAILCSIKPAWCRRWNRRIRDLVHDFANLPASPKNKQFYQTLFSSDKEILDNKHSVAGADARFPQARHKDWYDGHSWATGLVSYATGKSQESSSEASHAYFAVAVLGEALNDIKLRDWGRLLLATEVRSTRYYWHIPLSSSIYDSKFSMYNRITGSVAGSATVAATWFGANPEYVHGIQTLPVVPGLTDILFDPDYVCDQLPILENAFARPAPVNVADSWRGVALANVAIVDQHAAWHRALELDEKKFDDGASKANLLHWIATRPASINTCSFHVQPDDTHATSYNGLAINASDLEPWCSSNLACVAFGLSGACCPQPGGYVFGCCPVLFREDGTTGH